MLRTAALLAATLAVLTACAQSKAQSQATPTPQPAASGLGYPAAELANGRSIFQTGRDSGGRQIVANPPALFPKCAACHYPNGAGGRHFPHDVVSADLRHSALVADQHPPYTLATLERAISTGVDNQGQRLSTIMPRWQLSSTDLHDVAYYVLTSLK